MLHMLVDRRMGFQRTLKTTSMGRGGAATRGIECKKKRRTQERQCTYRPVASIQRSSKLMPEDRSKIPRWKPRFDDNANAVEVQCSSHDCAMNPIAMSLVRIINNHRLVRRHATRSTYSYTKRIVTESKYASAFCTAHGSGTVFHMA